MKKTLVIFALIVLAGTSACGRRYTCPTYLKNADDQKIRVQVETPKTEQSRN